MDDISETLHGQISELLKPHRVYLLKPVILNHSAQPCGRSANRFVALTLWRGYVVTNKQPVKVESSFSYLEISSINIHSLTQVVLETDRQTLSFTVLQVDDLEAIVSHMTASLKRVFPDSSPGKLLKTVPADLQQRLSVLTELIEEQLDAQSESCGGFSHTYAALCDFNEIPFREEIQWDVDNIYHIHNHRQFNLLDFNHLDSQDLALAVAALSSNQWFTKIYSKDFKLSIDVQRQLHFLMSRSPCLEELSLEASGLRLDFAIKMAAALRDHSSSSLQSINLSDNEIEDKGVIALSQELKNVGLRRLFLSQVSMSARGLGYLCQVLSSSQQFSSSLTHLDLSGNPGSLVTEEAMFLFKFLAGANSLSHLDLSDTNCPLDTLFVSLCAGSCFKLMHLNLARNPFSHRKVQGVTSSIREYFSQSCELKYVGLSATDLPPQALRLLLQGLAANTRLCGLELDLSSCELRSTGAQVIEDHICEATAISSLDISNNGFESDMVTLVLSVGRCHSLRHLALGRNFAMKSRALVDVLHRIAQLIQDDECALHSLSVCDSKLKTGAHILLSALSGRAALAQLDISGNAIGDTGAKILAKALMRNTKLRTLIWDRNNVSAQGFQDVADALERNFTLQQVSLPLDDITESYRNDPDRTKKALHQIQQCLMRNNQRQLQRQPDRMELQQGNRIQHSKGEKLVQALCQQLEDSLQHLNHIQAIKADVLAAQELIHNARESVKLLPSLYEEGRKFTSDEDSVNCILADTATTLTNELTRNTQELAQALLRCAENVCPGVVQRSSVYQNLSECVTKRSRQTHAFLRGTLVEHTGQVVSNTLCELRQTLTMSLVESIIEQLLQDIAKAQDKLDCHVKNNLFSDVRNNVPQFQPSERDFPLDDYSPAGWRNSFHCGSLRPAPSIKSPPDLGWENQIMETGAEREGGGGKFAGEEGGGGERCGLPRLPTATPLSVTTSRTSSFPSTSPFPSPLGRRRWREKGEVVDAGTAVSGAKETSFIPPLLSSTTSAQAPEEEAVCLGRLIRQEADFCGLPGLGYPASLMEPLPIQGQLLRHYTASRPRPRRTRLQPPSSRPQDPRSKPEEEGMGRVDEGVEEFFTKKIIQDYALKGQWEESNPVQATPSESSCTPSATAPLSFSSDIIFSSTTTIVTPPSAPSSEISLISPYVASHSSTITSTDTTFPSKNIKKKFGDFFAFKRTQAGRLAKAGRGEGGGGERVKVKRTSIADLIRPLREAKEKERGREKEKENERGTKSMEDTNISNDATITEGTIATSHHLTGDRREKTTSTLTMMTIPGEIAPSYRTSTATVPDLTTTSLCSMDKDAVTSLPILSDHSPSPVATPLMTTSVIEQEWGSIRGGTQYEERRLKATKRSLRDGKSQSLILLTGLEPEDKENAHSKKYVSESTASLEQRLQLMLHRIGVVKSPPADTKSSQNKEEDLRKTSSEGAILDKHEPPPTYMKPRTMSTSSADPRHPIQVSDPVRVDLPPHPKPFLPAHPLGPLPPKPAIATKPPLPTTAAPAGKGYYPSSCPPSRSSAERVQPTPQIHACKSGDSPAQNESQEHPLGAALAPSPRKDVATLSPWRDGSVTDESLPKSRLRLRPLPQRRAVSVHEEGLAMTQELKEVLQRSPICFRDNKGDLPTCTENPTNGEKMHMNERAERASEAGTKPENNKNVQREELNPERNLAACGVMVAENIQPSVTQEKPPALPTLDNPPALTQTPAYPLVTSIAKEKMSNTVPNLSQTLGKTLVSPQSPQRPPSKIPSASEYLGTPPVSPLPNKTQSTDTLAATVDVRNVTQKRGEMLFKQHTLKTEPPDQRTE